MSDPTPIFVLGLQRSGTTWLANLLIEHAAIAGVASEDHFGVHESIFFSHFARFFGDLTDQAERARFLAAFGDSDYFLLTGLEPEWLKGCGARDYPGFFRALMDEVARRRGARMWLEKSPHHTLLADQLARDFPDARFLCIVRGAAGQVRSRLGLTERGARYPGRAGEILRACSAASLYARHLREFAAGGANRRLVVFEELKADLEGGMRGIAEFLGVPFDGAMTRTSYTANSSFRSDEERRRELSTLDRLLIGAASRALSLVPLGTLRSMEERRRAERGEDWPDWCWRRRPRSA